MVAYAKSFEQAASALRKALSHIHLVVAVLSRIPTL